MSGFNNAIVKCFSIADDQVIYIRLLEETEARLDDHKADRESYDNVIGDLLDQAGDPEVRIDE
jgi:hypothetical protein